MAASVDIADGSFILTGSSGPAPAGNITIQADTISLTGGLPDEGLITNITTLGVGWLKAVRFHCLEEGRADKPFQSLTKGRS